MGIKDLFRKKNDVVDLSDLQKRGIYKPRLPEKDKEDVIDLSSEPSTTNEGSAFDFLGAMAASSSTETPVSEPSSVVLDGTKKQRLKGILRDLKSEMKQTSDKVYKFSERLDLLERKLDRIERRVGL